VKKAGGGFSGAKNKGVRFSLKKPAGRIGPEDRGWRAEKECGSSVGNWKRQEVEKKKIIQS